MDELKHPLSEHNARISTSIIELTHRLGNLLIHVNGEGKLDFRGAGQGWCGMIKNIISGDIGCMSPYEGYDSCALSQALNMLYGLDNVPHLNLSTNEQFVVDDANWKIFVDSIKEHFDDLDPHNYKPKYSFTLKGGDDGKATVCTVVIEPLCNTFVVGEFNAIEKFDFLGEISDYDQPGIKSCWMVCDGQTYDIDMNRLIHFRHRRYQPRKGDYLLYASQDDYYVVLPQEDYSIH